MANGRVQAPALQGNLTLRPAPIQSDTFAAPARPAQDNRLGQLAQALSTFSTSLGGYAQTMQPTEEERRRAIYIAERRIHGMTREEQNALSDAGQIPVYEKPFVRQAVHAVFGGTRGATFAADLKERMTTDFDWNTGDPDAFITNEINAYLQNSPYRDDPNFGANFMRNADSLRSWAIGYGHDRKVEQTVTDQEQAAFEFIDRFTRGQLEAGTDPAAVARNLFAQFPDLGKDGTLGVDNDRLDNIVLNVARRIAEEQPEGAMALVNHTRKGRDGMERSFAMDRDKQDTVLQIMDTAKRAMGRQSEARTRQQLADADLETYRGGSADAFRDVTFTTSDGRSVTVTKEDRMKAAEASYLNASEALARGRQETPQEKTFRDLRVARMNGRKLPYLEERLTNISDMATVDLIGDPDGKAKLLDKLLTYRVIRQESPGAINAYTSEKDRDFAEAFVDAVDFLGKSDDEALDFAIKVAQPIDASGRESLSKYQRQLDGAVNDIASKKGWFGIDWDSAPGNYSTVRTKVSQLAEKMVVAGLNPEDAIKMAAMSVKQRSTVHNGTVLFLQGLDVPDNFTDLVDEALAEFIEKNPKVVQRSGLDPEEMTIVPLGGDLSGGRFVIASKENPVATLHDDSGNVAVITLAGLRQVSARLTKEKEAASLQSSRQASFDHSVMQKGLVYARDHDGSLNWIDPKSREVFTFQYTEKDSYPIWKKTGKRYRRAQVVKEDGSFVLKGYEAGRWWGRLRGSDLKQYREDMKQWENDIDKAAERRRKFWGNILPSVKVGNTVLND
ncbi:hypothetical protein J2Y48_000431 [Mycoplana sp. BE70]|uniref:hypothetical protein n=1 Tax=Mycoplana sp. BE70 TaxID=2817775 RepID=UPI0028646CE8|nr:hypothetical protein [Mycoplana sp. BE70]MDR6755158.1 hypothetical protein [Mycoplana sp. BE70]